MRARATYYSSSWNVLKLSAAAAVLLSATPAVAQQIGQQSYGRVAPADNGDNGDKLAEIVVTANKREEKLQDVPVSINAITSDELERSGITDTSQLASLVPGLTIESSLNGIRPHLRGVGTTAISAGEENSVATYLDGIYVASMSTGLLQLENIEQIEVLKGPQGTLFGRNADGGVINVRTKDPEQNLSGNAHVGYGNFNTATVGGYVTGGLTENLAANLAVYYSHQGDGWGKNLFNGQAVHRENNSAGRSKIMLTPTDRDKITLAFDYSQSDGPSRDFRPVYGQPLEVGPGPTLAGQRPDFAPYVIPNGTVAPFAVVGTPYTYTGGFWDSDEYYQPKYNSKAGGAALRYSHDFDFGQITNFSSYRETFLSAFFTNDSVPAPVFGTTIIEKSYTYTEELQIVSDPQSTIKWAAGLYYLNSSVGYYPLSIVGTFFAPFARIAYNAVESTESEAAYGQATAPIAALGDTNLTLGLRETVDRRGITGNNQLFFDPAGPPIVLGQTDADQSFNKLTWRAALDHHFDPDLMGYLSYNRGFKSGLYNTIPASAVPIRPEVLDAYELGIKSEFLDKRLQINTAAFFYNYTDLQVTVYNQVAATLQNGAKARIYGLDLDATAKLTRGLTLTAGLEYVHDRFTSFPDAQLGIALPASAGGGNTFVAGSARGKELPVTPTFTSELSLNYRQPTSAGEFGLTGTYYYNSGWYASPDNVLHNPSHSLVALALDWNLPNGKTTLSAWGKNLFNEKYYSFMTEVFNPGGESVGAPAAPRTFGVTVRQHF